VVCGGCLEVSWIGLEVWIWMEVGGWSDDESGLGMRVNLGFNPDLGIGYLSNSQNPSSGQ
jgi:hypothetical protein